MLHLHSTSPERWLSQVDQNLNVILIDHAHCEQKAASTAMHLMFEYVENEELRDEMTEIIAEELEHFHMVLALLKQRNIRFYKLKPGTYGRKLMELCRRQEPHKAIDRLLIAALFEARSCERFVLLRDHLQDSQLSDFYGSLYESEARHHATYVRLAQSYGSVDAVNCRLEGLAAAEATVVADGCELPRVHS
ncbi:MAG: tRNA-(ms[2]io[6]A)-hydroxylase [Fuerstiella sp.]|nr:tRNA-(ms[2]io[6]A)-hydroxylase [Fuerstiella sp.]MDG2128486.1 tRNA-(ms[2]io[6]A)-hydroxylase [Fuerstiella sp.]